MYGGGSRADIIISLSLANTLALKLHCKSVSDMGPGKVLHELLQSLQIFNSFRS